jgi:hypothetical protein
LPLAFPGRKLEAANRPRSWCVRQDQTTEHGQEYAFMQVKSFGKIAVPTPGTPVRLTTDTTLRVARLRFAAVIGETGRVFLGVAGMNKATGAGVIKEFWPTGADGGVADQIEITAARSGILVVLRHEISLELGRRQITEGGVQTLLVVYLFRLR